MWRALAGRGNHPAGWALRWAVGSGEWEVVSVSVDAAAEESGKWRSQEIERARSRRRRANIGDGEGRKVVKVRLTDAEYATVSAAAEESSMTVPRYLGECATNPVVPSRTKSGKERPWLPWPKRLALQRLLLSAASALHVVRLEQVSKVGSNLNQLARIANGAGVIDPELAEELVEALAQWRELSAELSERGARIEQLAQDVTRR